MPWMCVGAPSLSNASAASGNMAVFSSTCASTLVVGFTGSADACKTLEATMDSKDSKVPSAAVTYAEYWGSSEDRQKHFCNAIITWRVVHLMASLLLDSNGRSVLAAPLSASSLLHSSERLNVLRCKAQVVYPTSVRSS